MTEKNEPTPADILQDNHLSKKEKIKTLENLEEDQKALLRADDENMPSLPAKEELPPPAEMLKKIQSAERKLEQ